MNSKRQKILDEAVKVFAENNYYEAKTDEIARNAGVSKGIVFHYFETKENLYLQTLYHALEVIEEFMTEVPWPEGELTEVIAWSNSRKWLAAEKYPEITRLIFSAMGGVPENIQNLFLKKVTEYEEIGFNILDESVKKIPLKEGVERSDVVYLINQLMRVVYNDTLLYLRMHPNAKIDELSFLRDRSIKMLELIQSGFRKENAD